MLRTQFINFNSKKTHWNFEGQAIRVAYLCSDVIAASGSIYMYIDAENQYTSDLNEPYMRKLIELFCEKLEPPLPLKEAQDVFNTIKHFRSIKHKQQKEIISLKRLEKFQELIFKDCMNFFLANIQQSGLPQLIKLEDEELELVCGSSYLPEKVQELYHTGSSILKRKWAGKDEVYVLTIPFWDYAKQNNINIAAAEEADEQTDIITFRLPDVTILNFFSAAELKLIKKEIREQMQKLPDAIARWSEELKKTDFSPSEVNRYANYFSSEIAPALPGFEEKLQNCEALKKVTDFYKGKAGTENYLAVAKAKTLWDYLEWDDFVQKESMHAFMQQLPDGCDENKTVLLWLCNTFNHIVKDEEDDKKSLRL